MKSRMLVAHARAARKGLRYLDVIDVMLLHLMYAVRCALKLRRRALECIELAILTILEQSFMRKIVPQPPAPITRKVVRPADCALALCLASSSDNDVKIGLWTESSRFTEGRPFVESRSPRKLIEVSRLSTRPLKVAESSEIVYRRGVCLSLINITKRMFEVQMGLGERRERPGTRGNLVGYQQKSHTIRLSV